jgi:hypothetical protein
MVDDCDCNEMTHEEMVHQMDDQTLPFTQTKFDGYVIREFKPGYPAHLFKWHFDEEDRTIEVLEDSDWNFQYDNEFPIPLLTGIDINIPKGLYHRIIPGTTTLKLKIFLK